MLNEEETFTIEKILTHAWKSYAKDEIDVAHSMQTKAELSHGIAVMDRLGGWIEGGCIEDGS